MKDARNFDGQTVAIGGIPGRCSFRGGDVQGYELVGTTWTQIGADVVGPSDGDRFGFSVALTLDSSFLTIGANANDSYGNNADNRNLGVGVAISSYSRRAFRHCRSRRIFCISLYSLNIMVRAQSITLCVKLT